MRQVDLPAEHGATAAIVFRFLSPADAALANAAWASLIAQIVRFTVQRFKGWKRKRSIFMPFQLLNRKPFNREPA